MNLKENIDFAGFMKCISMCSGNVYFDTSEGDHLNLKSSVSQFVFAVFLGTTPDYQKASISCSNDDLTLLSDFLVAN